MALAFHAAHSSGDGAGACGLMIDAVRTELEHSSDQPCGTAIIEQPLSRAEQVLEVAEYGRNARVILDGDVAFLSVADGQWQVSAAGCEFRSNAPYDYTLTRG